MAALRLYATPDTGAGRTPPCRTPLSVYAGRLTHLLGGPVGVAAR